MTNKKKHRKKVPVGASRNPRRASDRTKSQPTPKQRSPVRSHLSSLANRYLGALKRGDYNLLRQELLSSSSVTYLKLYGGALALEKLPEAPPTVTIGTITLDINHIAGEILWAHPEAIPNLFAGIRGAMEEEGWLSPPWQVGAHTNHNTAHLLLISTPATTRPLPIFFVAKGDSYLVDFKSVLVFSTHPDAQRLTELAQTHLDAGDTIRALYYFKAVADLGPTYDSLQRLLVGNLATAQWVTPDRRAHLVEGSKFVALARKRVGELEELDARELDLAKVCEQGEGQTIEFMRDFPDQARELAREIAAFSTSNAGYIYLGIANDGTIVGLEAARTPLERDELRKRIDGTATTISPAVRVLVRFVDHNVDGESKTIVLIAVPKGSEPVYYVNSQPHLRAGQSSRTARPEEVAELHRRHVSR